MVKDGSKGQKIKRSNSCNYRKNNVYTHRKKKYMQTYMYSGQTYTHTHTLTSETDTGYGYFQCVQTECFIFY